MNPRLSTYLRQDRMPYIWCPGCGNGTVVIGLLEAFEKLQIDRNKTVIISGIGCSSRVPIYLDFDTLHTAHGRAIPFATGVKLANPDLKVFVITGDGDCSAIGGNHLIHAARRNIDLTVICINNSIYGMTNGQYSPTTPLKAHTATSPLGFSERSFDLCKLAIGAGATYVARSTTYHARMLCDYIVNAVSNKGFSFVDIITQCPIYFGRKNHMARPSRMLEWMKESSISGDEAVNLKPDELAGKIVVGEFVQSPAPEYTEEYGKIIRAAQAGGGLK